MRGCSNLGDLHMKNIKRKLPSSIEELTNMNIKKSPIYIV
jgi:hypothetical protein